MHTSIALRWILVLLLSFGVTRARRDNCSALPASLYPPIDRAGPSLTVPQVKLMSAVKCYPHVNASRQQAETYRWTLLIPGTSEHVKELFDWNWIPVLHAYRWPYCTLQLPRRGMSDLQVAAEYVVYALRYISKLVEQERQVDRQCKRRINIIGHSLGGVLPRFALRFWPDTRRLIRHLVAFAPSNHGTLTADTACSLNPCAPSLQQQRLHSNFLCALNSYQETFPEISYTNILTRWDEIIFPVTSSELTVKPRVRNVYIQDWCPMRLFSEHLGLGTYDHCAFVLTIRALQSKSLANVTNCCEHMLMPGITIGVNDFLKQFLSIVAKNARVMLEYEDKVADEPELRCVFRTDCIRSVRQVKEMKRR